MPESIRIPRIILAMLAVVVVTTFPDWRQVMANVGGYTTVEEEKAAEHFALTVLYQATNGDQWTNKTGWLGEAGTQCSWFGIACDGEGFVTGINLSVLENSTLIGNNLSGVIPQEIELLSRLRNLTLPNNQLVGPIPASIGNLTNLESINLGQNDLSGELPEQLWNLTKLRQLYLYDNNFEGSISAAIGALTDLRNIGLWSNGFSGPLPASLGNLSQLTQLDIGGNSFIGTIPDEIYALANLTRLSIWGSELTGSLSELLGNLEKLEYVYLNSNNLSGRIPESIVSLTSLKVLSLADNQLTGTVPEALFDLPLLTSISLSGNQLLIPLADPNERNALIAFYSALGGDNWTNNTGWLGEPGTECNWYGITCGSDRHVSEIKLSTIVNGSWVGNNLTGTLPEQIGAFQKLKNLTLPQNAISGALPASIGNLTSLEVLHLSRNQLTGSIPDGLWGLTNLRQLYLTDNQLSGTLSSQIGQLTQLRNLGLWSNSLEGALPLSLGNLSELTQLSIGNNNFSGTIPNEIYGLVKLSSLDLYNNEFTGGISANIGQLTNLQTLRLENNNLTGSLPATIGNLERLKYLYLFNNQLSGTLPDSLTQLDQLIVLSLTNNQFTGVVPAGLYDMPLLTTIGLSGNQFLIPLTNPLERDALIAFYNALDGDNWINNTGWLGEPGSECTWYGVSCSSDRYVTSISFPTSTENNVTVGNNLSGELPPEIGVFSRLQILSLSHNDITGPVPAQISQLTNAIIIYLHGNQLSGSLPEEIGMLTNLRYLNLYGNEISGAIPSSIGSLTNLQSLILSFNNFSGVIPESIGQLTALTQILLHENQLTGTIPSSVGNLEKLTTLFLYRNQLSGEIPATLGNLPELNTLSLSVNKLTGEVPETLAQLSKLEKLHLSYNELTGTIPNWLMNLPNLDSLLLDNNNFSGVLPDGLLDKESLISFRYFGNYIPHAPISQPQRDALIAFYQAAGGENWINNRQWLGEPGTECNWFGVQCASDLKIIGLTLGSNQLSGTITASLADLPDLSYLILSNNSLTGVVPDIFGEGVTLVLEGNQFDEGSVSPQQIVSVQGNPLFFLSSANTLSFEYNTSDNDTTLTGVGIRVHIDSRTIDLAMFKDVLSASLIAVDTSWNQDTQDFDNNPLTDLYATIAWTDISGNWPGTLPIKLFDLELTAQSNVTTSDEIHIGFSRASNTPGYDLELPQLALTPVDITLDVDGNGSVEALTDALMIIRKLFGFSGNALVDRAVATDATFTTSEQIQSRLTAMNTILDVDGNGNVDALTDGLLIMRYVFGFRGAVLINNAIGNGATRTSAGQIEDYLSGFVH